MKENRKSCRAKNGKQLETNNVSNYSCEYSYIDINKRRFARIPVRQTIPILQGNIWMRDFRQNLINALLCPAQRSVKGPKSDKYIHCLLVLFKYIRDALLSLNFHRHLHWLFIVSKYEEFLNSKDFKKFQILQILANYTKYSYRYQCVT